MTVDQTLQQVFRLALPEAVLVANACVLFLLSTVKGLNRTTASVLALLGLGVATALHFTNAPPEGLLATVTPLLPNALATFVRLTAFATGGLLVFFTWNEAEERHHADYLGCLLCATAGFSLIGAANDLIVLFLALELLSIPTYVMLYLPKANDSKAQEATIKYFMLSVLSSAFMLFGFSYLYGTTGSTNIGAIAELLPRFVAGDSATSALLALSLIMVGLGFRVTAFPFHFYAPDVYQASPLGTVAFLAFVPKVAGFVVAMKLFHFVSTAHPVANEFVKQVMMLLWILATVSMTAGNVMGVLQNNVRRMLAYSGVANAGYMLIGLAVIPAQAYHSGSETLFASGGEAILFYLIAYGAMTVGAFAILAMLHTPERPVETVDDLAGLHRSHPGSALLLAIFLLSMIGLPLTAGFVGKLLLFIGAMAAPSSAPMHELFRVLALIGAVNAAVAAYYYLRVLMAVYLRSSLHAPTAKPAPLLMIVAIICAVLTVALGVYPMPLLDIVRPAFASL